MSLGKTPEARSSRTELRKVIDLSQDGSIWLAAANLIIWSGLFAYLWSLDKKISRIEDDRPKS